MIECSQFGAQKKRELTLSGSKAVGNAPIMR